ncbi:Glutamate--tRNA ligase [compost metagenome]
MFSREELVQAFNAARLSKSPAVFDTNKLAWMNNEYIKKADAERVVDLCLPHLRKAGRVSETMNAEEQAWVTDLVKLYQDKLRSGSDIVPLTELFFQDSVTDEGDAADVLAEEQVPTVLGAYLAQVEASESFGADDQKALIKAVQQETGCKGKQLFMPIRAALTGQTHGPDLNQTIALLGKEKVTERLKLRLGR